MVVCNGSFLKFEMSASRVENGLAGWFSFKNGLAGWFSFMSHGWVKKQLYVTSDSALCRSELVKKQLYVAISLNLCMLARGIW